MPIYGANVLSIGSRRSGFAYAGQAGGGGAQIVLSASSIADDASVGDAVGTLSVINGSGSYTFTEVADPSTLFAIDVAAVEVAGALTVGSYSYTVQADNGVDDPIQRTFTITVTAASAYTPAFMFDDPRNSMYLGAM